MPLNLESGDGQALDHFERNVAPTLNGPDLAALLSDVLFFERVEQIAIKARVPIQTVIAIEHRLKRVHLEGLSRALRDAFDNDDEFFCFDALLGRDDQDGMRAEDGASSDFPGPHLALMGCALINRRMDGSSSRSGFE